jgi:hypothetical protein
MQRVAKHSIEIGAICARQVIKPMQWLKKSKKEFTPTPSKSLGSVGMKKEKDFTKQRNPNGQDAGAILLWGDIISNKWVTILTHQMV